jgi:hypothetical protein
VKPRHASPQRPNGLSRGASMRFNAHAIGGIKNLKGATELELNFSVRRHIKWPAYEHPSPVPKPSGSPAVKPHPAGDRPATGASRSCVALAKSASAPPLWGMHCLAIKVPEQMDLVALRRVSGRAIRRRLSLALPRLMCHLGGALIIIARHRSTRVPGTPPRWQAFQATHLALM